MLKSIRRVLRWIRRAVGITIGLLLMILLLQGSTVPQGSQWDGIATLASANQFDYIGWEIDALWTKFTQGIWGRHAFMSEGERSQFVRDYMADLARARELEAQVNAIYTDPAIGDPEAASSALRAERYALRADLASRQPTAEAILEGQVAAVLVDLGFGTMGQLLPPVAMHFTRVPNLLIVSPRDTIRFDVSINLDPMPIDEIAALEARIAREYDVSALVVPLGGIALYPAMILETTSIPWAVETFAHEWLHHYLFFFPLGLSYFSGEGDFAGETRIINETVADTFGKAVAPLVLARYYPELLAEAPAPPGSTADLALTVDVRYAPREQADPPAFDFGAAMHQTRVTVDAATAAARTYEAAGAALAAVPGLGSTFAQMSEGHVHATEAYMETRRQLFYTNGYRIRRLNQAYFAFYGGYQAGGIPGVGGQDPIGPAVAEIFALSGDIHDFVIRVRGVTRREGLLALRDSLQAGAVTSG